MKSRYKYKLFGKNIFVASHNRNWGIFSKQQISDTKNNITDDIIKKKLPENQRLLKNSQSRVQERPSLFIFWVTHNCNLRCIYCQAGSQNKQNQLHLEKNDWDSDKTIKKIFKFIFNTTKSRSIAVEFQGGEPLFHFERIKRITVLGKELSAKNKRNIKFLCTSNFTLLDKDKLDFCKKYNIQLCSSMDGFKEINDKNRLFANGKGTYDTIIKNRELYVEAMNKKCGNISVINENHLGVCRS